MTPRISRLMWNAFGRYAEWYVPRHFHGVRLRKGSMAMTKMDGPLIVYLNHPSWWDPMMCILLARRLWPGRKHYAPMDAEALRRYRFLGKLGFFGVEQGSARGGIRFLRTAREILEQEDGTLWITAQGQFTDVRRRPMELRAGLGHLLSRLERATLLPLALEYPFWEEKHPEALAAFGSATSVTEAPHRDPMEWTAVLERGLQETVDALGADAISRDAARFELLHEGAAGVQLFYDLWRRGAARWRGQRFRREHGVATR